MRIGLFTDTYFPQINGVGASVHTLAQNLRARGHDVYILTPSDPRRREDEDPNIINMASMPFVFIRQFRTGLLFSPAEMARIARLHLDVVHTQTEFSLGMAGKIFAKFMHLPMVHTYHTMYVDYTHYIAGGALVTPAMAREFSKLFCNTADAVIAPTQKVKDTLRRYGVVKPIRVIPTGIPIEHFRRDRYRPEEIAAIRRQLGLLPDTPVVLSLGRVAKEKSIDVILSAMPALLQKIPRAMLVVVGDGPYAEVLKQQAAALGIQKHVLFTGAKPWSDIGKYYQLGDVFVSASTSETQGLTFAEAMAAGIPVIAKQDESIEGIIQDEKTGLLFQRDGELPEKLYELLSDPDKRRQLTETAMALVESLSAEQFAKSVEALYEDVLTAYPAHIRHHRMYRGLTTVTNGIGKEILKTRRLLSDVTERPQQLVRRLSNDRKKDDK